MGIHSTIGVFVGLIHEALIEISKKIGEESEKNPDNIRLIFYQVLSIF